MIESKVCSIPQTSFSASSSNHDNDDRLECPSKIDLPYSDGHMDIEQFLDWLVEVERFFEHAQIAEVRQEKLVAHKLKASAYGWWEKLQRMRIRLGKEPVKK